MDTTQRHIWNTVKHLRWSIFRKKVEGFESLTTFAKRSILDVWQGSEYDSVEPEEETNTKAGAIEVIQR